MKYILTAVLVSFGFGIANADMRGNIETGRAALATQKKALITNAMQLTPEQSQVFWPLYNDYAEAMRKVGDEKVNLITDYAKNFETITDEKASELLDKLISVEADRAKVRGDYVKKFRKALPGREVARFFQADNKIEAYINASLADEIPLIPTPAIKKLAAQQAAANDAAAKQASKPAK
jgi:hypothetical protein